MAHKQIQVIKIGGEVLNQEALLHPFLDAFAQIPGFKILVHGGGRMATQMAARLGIEAKMINGRRITDDAMLEIVTMTYAGWINKTIVAQLHRRGVQALGLSGADADLIRAHQRQHPTIDFGRVGDVDTVDAPMLYRLIEAALTPIICPITHNGQGQLLNTNADTIAAEVATALASDFEVTLKYCFEYPGVLSDLEKQMVIPRIDIQALETLKAEKTIHSGMLPKLDNAFRAKASGVAQVAICGFQNLISEQGVTWII